MLKTIRWCFGLCMAFAQCAMANVIYDVTVRYEVPGIIGAELTFTMEFSDSSGTKSIADLIGGDFTDESLVINGSTQVALASDNNTNALQFSAADPQSIIFTSSDLFAQPFLPGQGCFAQTQAALSCSGPSGAFSIPVEEIVVQERTIAVPLPGVIALLLWGLPGMLLVRRSDSRRRTARPILPLAV